MSKWGGLWSICSPTYDSGIGFQPMDKCIQLFRAASPLHQLAAGNPGLRLVGDCMRRLDAFYNLPHFQSPTPG